MKRVLVVGSNSYIGCQFRSYAEAYRDYKIDALSVRSDEWKSKPLQGYDSIVYCAALVHQKKKSHTYEEYIKINTQLPAAVAEKAKAEGVKQFLFLSTMAVYGLEGQLGRSAVIGMQTEPAPKTDYGRSKLEAEQQLAGLASDEFQVCILRPPMVYGSDCPGNYTRLKQFVLKYGVFPAIQNERSVISIENLCTVIAEELEGGRAEKYSQSSCCGFPKKTSVRIRHPQDQQYACTLSMVKAISEENGKKLHVSKLLVPIVYLAGHFIGTVHKVFGSLIYDMDIDK